MPEVDDAWRRPRECAAAGCETEYVPARRAQRFCSTTCRAAGWHRDRALQEADGELHEAVRAYADAYDGYLQYRGAKFGEDDHAPKKLAITYDDARRRLWWLVGIRLKTNGTRR